jgi:hypothetical protein
MLARVRTLLDEAAASYWTDAESYASLADGQNAAIDMLIGAYRAKKRVDPNTKLSYELEAVLNDNTATDDTIAVPSGFMELVSATYDHNGSGGENPCIISDVRKAQLNEDNTYLAADETSPVVYIKTTGDTVNLEFLPVKSGTPATSYWFIVSPTDIASGQNAVLPVSTHNAIVYFATAKLLQKDERLQESAHWMNMFNQEMSKVA